MAIKQFSPGDTIAAIRLAKANQPATSEKGVTRPDGRDVFNNAGNSLADPYQGNYPWVIPPPTFQQIFEENSVAAPAYGTQVQLTSFTVPQAMEAIINYIVLEYDGSGYTIGSGAITYSVDINRPLGATTQGYNPPGWGAILSQLGNVMYQPWPIPGGIRLYERDTIRIKALTANPLGIGAPNYITGILMGWYYPVKLPFPVQPLAVRNG
jgi:hypothetical protein